MPFLPLPEDSELSADAAAAADREALLHGTVRDNLSRTLLSHVPSYSAYAQWRVIWDELVPYIGERAVTLFAFAITDAAGESAPAAALRKIVVDSGDDPDDPQVTDTEKLLLEWGQKIGSDPRAIDDEFRGRLERAFQPKLRILLVSFAGLTVARTTVAIVADIPLDE